MKNDQYVSDAKVEKHAAKLGMPATATVVEVESAWAARKATKRAAKAVALGLSATATREEVKAAKRAKKNAERATVAVPVATVSVAPLWDARSGRYFSAEEMKVLSSSNSVEETARKLRDLRAKGDIK